MSRLEEFFGRHPVFAREEFRQYVNADWKRSDWTIKNMLAHHMDSGRIGRVRQGLYFSVPPGHAVEQFQPNPYLIASRVREDAVLGYHTALDFHGHAHFMHRRYLYLTNSPPRPFSYQDVEFKAVKFPKALRKQNREMVYVEEGDVAGLSVAVTNLERTLVDCLDRPGLAGGWESIWRSFTGLGFLRLDQIIDYTKWLNNGTTAAKVGFFLEEHRKELSFKAGDLKPLKMLIPGQPRYMDQKYAENTLIKRWNLIVPDFILKRAWEEF